MTTIYNHKRWTVEQDGETYTITTPDSLTRTLTNDEAEDFRRDFDAYDGFQNRAVISKFLLACYF